MFSTKRNVLQLLSLLKQHGINKFVVSPGSRHIPIVISMQCDPFFKLYSVVDERSASFFALGLIQKNNEPVGIICTSGTASANYCSAISEAYYQRLPLLIVTADRLDCYRDQQEDQQIHQHLEYKNVAKWVANLPDIHDADEEWYCNRLINEALLELRHRGDGPVQINIPVKNHSDNFTTKEIPLVRKIERYDLSSGKDFWVGKAKYISDKKIILIVGEGFPMNEEQHRQLDRFLKRFNCVVLADKMSNCHHEHSVENAFPVISAVSSGDVEVLRPDLIISCRANYSFNPEFKGFVKRCNKPIEHWYVHASGNIVDPFTTLSTVFEMDEFKFMELMSDAGTERTDLEYPELWSVISASIEEPNLDYCHITAVGKFLRSLPANSYLHLANSNSVRMAQLFDIDESIEVHCNRGTDGIDGCMSTAVGFAADTNLPVFLMIGDLTFFYDMNALWNRQLGNNVRILLGNNSGGAIMHMPHRPKHALELLPNCISAAHHTSAKAWVEDRGFEYISATNMQELESGIERLTNTNTKGPVILEVFTDMLTDTKIFKEYYASINRQKLDTSLKNRSKQFAKKILDALGLTEQVREMLNNLKTGGVICSISDSSLYERATNGVILNVAA